MSEGQEQQAGAAPDGLPQPRRGWAVFAISGGTAVIMIDGTIATVALPTIAADLNVPGSSAVLIITIYQLVLVMALLPLSALGERIGLRRLYQAGLALFTAATALCFFAENLTVLLAARVGQALGTAAALSVSAAIVRTVYPAAQLGRGLALNSIVVFVSSAAAPSIGGFILSVAPWQWMFGAGVPFALLSLFAGRVALPDPQPGDESYDLPGALLCALMFGLLVSGLELLVRGAALFVALPVLAAGLIAGFFSVRRARGGQTPVLPLDLLGYPVIALSVAGALASFVAAMTFTLSVPFWLQHEFAFTPAQVGALLSVWPLTLLVVSPLAGALSDKLPAGLLGSVGMALAAIGMALFATLPADASSFGIVLRLVISAMGFGLFFTPNARLILGSAPKRRTAAAGGMVATTRLTGQTLGATVLAALLAMGVGEGRTPAIVAGVLALVAGVLSLARLRPTLTPVNSDDA